MAHWIANIDNWFASEEYLCPVCRRASREFGRVGTGIDLGNGQVGVVCKSCDTGKNAGCPRCGHRFNYFNDSVMMKPNSPDIPEEDRVFLLPHCPRCADHGFPTIAIAPRNFRMSFGLFLRKLSALLYGHPKPANPFLISSLPLVARIFYQAKYKLIKWLGGQSNPDGNEFRAAFPENYYLIDEIPEEEIAGGFRRAFIAILKGKFTGWKTFAFPVGESLS